MGEQEGRKEGGGCRRWQTPSHLYFLSGSKQIRTAGTPRLRRPRCPRTPKRTMNTGCIQGVSVHLLHPLNNRINHKADIQCTWNFDLTVRLKQHILIRKSKLFQAVKSWAHVSRCGRCRFTYVVWESCLFLIPVCRPDVWWWTCRRLSAAAAPPVGSTEL